MRDRDHDLDFGARASPRDASDDGDGDASVVVGVRREWTTTTRVDERHHDSSRDGDLGGDWNDGWSVLHGRTTKREGGGDAREEVVVNRRGRGWSR